MSIDGFITRMRVRQANLFDTTVAVTRHSGGHGTLDPATATYSAAATPTTIYTGPALVRPDVDQVVAAGDTSVEVDDFVVKLPTDTAVELGDIVTVTASDHDAGLVGLALRITKINNDEWQIARRCRAVVETPRPT